MVIPTVTPHCWQILLVHVWRILLTVQLVIFCPSALGAKNLWKMIKGTPQWRDSEVRLAVVRHTFIFLPLRNRAFRCYHRDHRLDTDNKCTRAV